MSCALLASQLSDVPVRRGKVRDVYDFGDRLLFVATDRISAFDYVLPVGIPDKGRVLTELSRMWFDLLDVDHHFLSMNLGDLDLPDDTDFESINGRSMIVRSTEVIPIECVVRGYLSGSGWNESRESGTVCGISLPSGLRESDKLEQAIFTPSTKEDEGHDINITFQEMCDRVGTELANRLRDLSLEVYSRGAEYARSRGVIIADTKFEFGQVDGRILLIDEVLTPDSSRFWPADRYQPGGAQPSFDKQFVRDWLLSTDWDRNSTPPALPDDIVHRTREKYIEAYETLVGRAFEK